MSKKITTKQIVFSAMAIALATVISVAIKLPSLPLGGSITAFSMLIICLIGYWYGPKTGIVAAVAYGILQFIVGPYFVHPLQVLLDFPLAFGALGLSGFFCSARHGLIKGYLCGVLGRFLFHCISGVIFYTTYVNDFGGNVAAIWTGVVYNMTYIVPEAVITLLVIALPPVSQALAQLKKVATE